MKGRSRQRHDDRIQRSCHPALARLADCNCVADNCVSGNWKVQTWYMSEDITGADTAFAVVNADPADVHVDATALAPDDTVVAAAGA